MTSIGLQNLIVNDITKWGAWAKGHPYIHVTVSKLYNSIIELKLNSNTKLYYSIIPFHTIPIRAYCTL